MNKIKKVEIALLVLVAIVAMLQGCKAKDAEFVDVTVSESVFTDKYHYEQITAQKQEVYREIYQGLSEQKEAFNVHCKSGTEANDIFYAVLYDFPEIFWSDGEVVSTEYSDGYVTVKPEYNCSTKEKERKKEEIEKIAKEILEQAPTTDSEYEKIKYVYEYLVDHVEYVEGAQDKQNIYSSLVGRKSVCAGYAKATQYLLQQMDISCIYVTGEATSRDVTVPHAWNIVKCDGVYYYVDTTWADPLFGSNQDPNLNTHMIYDYLCCSSAMLSPTHTIDQKYVYPICGIDNLNYYRLNDMFYDSIDKTELRQVLHQSIDKKEESVLFKFASKELYREGRDVLIKELLEEAAQYLGEKYEIPRVSCQYSEDEQLCKVIIFWSYTK